MSPVVLGIILGVFGLIESKQYNPAEERAQLERWTKEDHENKFNRFFK